VSAFLSFFPPFFFFPPLPHILNSLFLCGSFGRTLEAGSSFFFFYDSALCLRDRRFPDFFFCPGDGRRGEPSGLSVTFFWARHGRWIFFGFAPVGGRLSGFFPSLDHRFIFLSAVVFLPPRTRMPYFFLISHFFGSVPFVPSSSVACELTLCPLLVSEGGNVALNSCLYLPFKICRSPP